MPLPKSVRHWLHGVISAFIGGGATVVSAQSGLAMAQVVGIHAALMDLKTMVIVFFTSGFFSMMAYLKQSPLPPEDAYIVEAQINPEIAKRAKDNGGFSLIEVMVIIGLICLIIICLTGCAIGGGALASKHLEHSWTDLEGLKHTVTSNDIVKTKPWVAWGDSRQAIGSQKVSNTKSGNAIGQTGLEQETTSTNLPAIIGSGGKLLGEATRAFMGLPPSPQ